MYEPSSALAAELGRFGVGAGPGQASAPKKQAKPERKKKEEATSTKQDGPSSDDIWDRKGPRDKPPHEMLANAAQLQVVMGDYAGAVDLFEQAVRLKPDSTELKYKLELNLGRKFKQMGHKVRARQHFESAVELAPRGMHAAEEELEAAGGGKKKSSGGLASKILGWGGGKKKKK